MINENQIEQIKQQLIQQIESTFPEDKKQAAIEQIESMNQQELEDFLISNNLIESNTQSEKESVQKCIFCSIIFGDMPSTKISENEKAIAILEINPVSKGHALVIPKSHISDKNKVPAEAHDLANQISEKLKMIFNPKEVFIATSNILGHEAINVIPVYESESLESKRYHARPEELQEVQKLLTEELKNPKVEKKEEQEKPKQISEKTHWLPKRVP